MRMLAFFGFWLIVVAVAACLGLALALFMGAGQK